MSLSTSTSSPSAGPPPGGPRPAVPRGTHALAAGLVDYAGLFPPAALPMAAAVETYAAERAGPEAWMLARFLVPAARLAELDAHADRLAGARAAGAPWRLSVLGHAPAADTPDAWLAAATRTVADAAEADAARGTLADRFELRLSPPLARDADGLARALAALVPRLPDGAAVAVEVPFLAHPDAVAPAAHAVAEAVARVGRDGSPAPFALKLRCGGETPETIPPVETLARALTDARRAGVAFKATAGLHEPLRHPDATVGATMHGFVNVFGGAALAARHDLDADALAELLDDGDAAHWRLGDDGLAWRALRVSPDEIAQARAGAALSFGSCSFAEPRDGLRALGWL